VIKFIKRILKQAMSFICDQYVVLFFIVTTGYKLFIFNTYITKVTWPENQYNYGIICGYLSVAVIFSALFVVRRHKNKLATLLATFLAVLLLIDTIYYSYFAALPTAGLISTLGQTQDVGPAIGTLLHWWYVLYFVDIALVLIFRKNIKSLTSLFKENDIKKPKMRTSWTAVGIILVAFWMSLLPMGLNTLADVFDKGYDTVSTSQYYGVFMSHAIDITRFIQQGTTRLSSSQEKELYDWVKTNKPEQTTSPLTGSAKGKNVIMIQVESLSGFVMNQKINNKEITPNLNKLARTSQFFPNDRYLYGAGHTSDTDFVANSSYFPLPDAAVFVRYGQDNFTSMPKTLISNGYSAYAYHSFNRNFWNRDVAFESLGYQKFYAANNYPKGTNINMGLNDGDFLSKTADYIKAQPKPSLSYVITLSSHVPFEVTDQTKDLGVNTADYPNQVGGYLENINYTDRMLGKFFDRLKSNNLYDDSIIIIYGDHNPVLPAFNAVTIKYDPESTQSKEVPLIIKIPSQNNGETHNNQGSHLDIMPTVLDLLGIKTTELMFGQSLFAQGKNALKICADQLPVFSSEGDCNTMLTDEKNQSATIIRYNQFNNLLK
jgi:phosphoglycerol transferase MdoB-like AlkP superfamily enzyme